MKLLFDIVTACHGKLRIDAPGALHHIIVSRIERRKIFLDDFGRHKV